MPIYEDVEVNKKKDVPRLESFSLKESIELALKFNLSRDFIMEYILGIKAPKEDK